jgi:pyridoxamine 5'-phosphate oxidase
MSLAELRRSYERESLLEGSVDPDPLKQFDVWFTQALESAVPEPNAMTLSTVGADGRPSSRIVLVKGYDLELPPGPATGRGFLWYTNYASRKGLELAIHPHACLLFFWTPLERQVRIEGRVERALAEESDEYFKTRPLDSQVGAWASPQSAVVASREVLDSEHARFAQQYGGDVPRPPHWGGYRLVPDAFEFWQGRPSRMHDRIHYRLLANGQWQVERLAP